MGDAFGSYPRGFDEGQGVLWEGRPARSAAPALAGYRVVATALLLFLALSLPVMIPTLILWYLRTINFSMAPTP